MTTQDRIVWLETFPEVEWREDIRTYTGEVAGMQIDVIEDENGNLRSRVGYVTVMIREKDGPGVRFWEFDAASAEHLKPATPK